MGENSGQGSVSPAGMHESSELEILALPKPMASARSDARPQAASLESVCCVQTQPAIVNCSIEKVFNKDSAKRTRTQSPDAAAHRVAKLSKQDLAHDRARNQWCDASLVEDSILLDQEIAYWQQEAMQSECDEKTQTISAAQEFAEHEHFMLRNAFWRAEDIAWNSNWQADHVITRSPGEADTEWHAAFQDAWTQGVSSVLSTLYPVVYPETTFNAHRDARAVLQTLWDT